MEKRTVYSFGAGGADGGPELLDLLGGKGAHLGEMVRLGLPVPPGFTITTEACRAFLETGDLPGTVRAEIHAAIQQLESETSLRLGAATAPLLVSVRSGARASMPGMMDTVLDLGLNDETIGGIARRASDWRFALDCYRRFCAMYGGVVLGLGDEPFHALLEDQKRLRRAATDADLTQADLAALVERSKALILEKTGHPLPSDPVEQLFGAITAVFRSWNNPRAEAYRKAHGIPSDWGTAVTVQQMVFGNLGNTSASGVAFSRDPSTGARGMIGEFLVGAQGEDVVAGIRTPEQVARMNEWNPAVHAQLEECCKRLERHFGDVQDVEFTVERSKLYVLQCRSAKRTATAEVRFAVELAQDGLITREQAVKRVTTRAIEQVQRPHFSPGGIEAAASRLLGAGLPAGPGAASGKLALTPAAAERMRATGAPVILARLQTSPEDIRGMIAADGLLTAHGGMSSHAALVARQMGKVAVVGCAALRIEGNAAIFGNRTLLEGDTISLDGDRGEVYSGAVPMAPATALSTDGETLLSWADSFRTLGIRANADEGGQARSARKLGAEGIGLCRTEHMFFGPGKIEPMRELILANTPEGRRAALDKLLPLQRTDFLDLFRAMDGLPVTIRLLDPPLHEFIPQDEEGLARLAVAADLPLPELRKRAASLAETNPMLGLRGCRLGITRPEITQMQVRAIFEAACEATAIGVHVHPHVMVPLVADAGELKHQAALISAVAAEVFVSRQLRVPYTIGAMIEVPRAALTAGEIARTAEFFSFGTNDLTQMTMGLSRDDVGPVLKRYLELGILRSDPFATIDQAGVGELMRLAIERGRATRPTLELGICGEHGGDPASVAFCHELGLDYVSCSPSRIPVARLAAAHAALRSPDRRPRPSAAPPAPESALHV